MTKTHVCCVCSKEYTDRSNYNKHVKTCGTKVPGAFACPYEGCAKSYHHEESRMRHKKTCPCRPGIAVVDPADSTNNTSTTINNSPVINSPNNTINFNNTTNVTNVHHHHHHHYDVASCDKSFSYEDLAKLLQDERFKDVFDRIIERRNLYNQLDDVNAVIFFNKDHRDRMTAYAGDCFESDLAIVFDNYRKTWHPCNIMWLAKTMNGRSTELVGMKLESSRVPRATEEAIRHQMRMIDMAHLDDYAWQTVRLLRELSPLVLDGHRHGKLAEKTYDKHIETKQDVPESAPLPQAWPEMW